MPGMRLRLQLRPSTLDDAAMVADLHMERDPDDVTDPVLLRYWWEMTSEMQRAMRQVAVHDGAALAYLGAQHERWRPGDKRFGVVRVVIAARAWTEEAYAELVATGEQWLREEGATTAVVRIREDIVRELSALQRLGYREDRRMRTSELDLVAHREDILRTVEDCRREMRRQGVDLHPLSEDTDPGRYQQLYEMVIESERDIPTTVPWRVLTFPEWKRFWLGNPGIREDRFWIAREDGRIVGTSVLDCPVVRGLPWTAFTGTLRSVRGRGIARALKYESMAQALAAGFTRVRTNNDADNPSILRINNQMGYRLVTPIVELHRPLA
jgi:GNAT superfamily N-acetyltransferase